jgi:hypothetical protein
LIEIEKDMLFPCIETIFRLISGCGNLEEFFAECRSIIMILVHSTRKVGDHLKEREDRQCVINAEDWDISLKNALL